MKAIEVHVFSCSGENSPQTLQLPPKILPVNINLMNLSELVFSLGALTWKLLGLWNCLRMQNNSQKAQSWNIFGGMPPEDCRLFPLDRCPPPLIFEPFSPNLKSYRLNPDLSAILIKHMHSWFSGALHCILRYKDSCLCASILASPYLPQSDIDSWRSSWSLPREIYSCLLIAVGVGSWVLNQTKK